MKTRNLFVITALVASACFAAEEAKAEAPAVEAPAAEAPAAEPNAVEACKASIDAASKDVPANAVSAKYSLAAAKATLADLEAAFNDDPESDGVKALANKCDMTAKIAAVQAETQALRNHTAENWEKRAATARSIEAIQEQIGQARSGKVNDLEAEKAKMKDQEARLQAEMQQNQEKFQAEAAAKEAALKAASEREANLQKQQAALQQQLEAEKKALAEERAKAEARQAEAMNKLNELQSKLIQVTKDARGIILSMSDILFDVNKASLKADLKTSLAKVAGILSVYQQFNVSIEGNTDNTGSAEHNMKLSQQRADNKTKEGRQKNRRVDLVIQDKALQNAEPVAEPAAPAEGAAPAAEPAKK